MKTTTLPLKQSMSRSCCPLALLLIPFALACFALSPIAGAVDPPPDGCYPNFTTAEGCDALDSLTTGSGNTAIGWRSLFLNTDASLNTGVGGGALALNDGDANTAVGAAALLLNTSGSQNVALGTNALLNNAAGSGNIVLGDNAGLNLTTGNNNIYIGNQGDLGDESNTIRIGTVDSHSRIFLAGLVGGFGSLQVVADPIGQLMVTTSSARFKERIRPMDRDSDALFALKPVTFRYKREIDPAGTSQFGLVAEDVQKVNPDLVVRDEEGKAFSVRYDQVNAMLLNEFLKEHRKTEKLEAAVVRQQKQIEALTAGLQRVSAQLELNKPAPQTVKNND